MVHTFNIANLDYFILSINSLKYLRSTTLDYKDIEIRKSEFVANLNSFTKFNFFWLISKPDPVGLSLFI